MSNMRTNTIVQFPFQGGFRELDVMNNANLFRKTTKLRENSLNSHINALELRRPNTGLSSKPHIGKLSDQESANGMVQNMYSSFGTNFPFFSTENLKEEVQTEKGKGIRLLKYLLNLLNLK